MAQGVAMRTSKLLIIAFVVATGAFWATMLTNPPQSTAQAGPGLDTRALTLDAAPTMGQHHDAF